MDALSLLLFCVAVSNFSYFITGLPLSAPCFTVTVCQFVMGPVCLSALFLSLPLSLFLSLSLPLSRFLLLCLPLPLSLSLSLSLSLCLSFFLTAGFSGKAAPVQGVNWLPPIPQSLFDLSTACQMPDLCSRVCPAVMFPVMRLRLRAHLNSTALGREACRSSAVCDLECQKETRAV